MFLYVSDLVKNILDGIEVIIGYFSNMHHSHKVWINVLVFFTFHAGRVTENYY